MERFQYNTVTDVQERVMEGFGSISDSCGDKKIGGIWVQKGTIVEVRETEEFWSNKKIFVGERRTEGFGSNRGTFVR